MQSTRRDPLIWALILSAFAWLLIAYAPGLHESFFNIDDADLISIPQIRAPFSWSLVKTWFTPGAHLDLYPFRDLTYWMDVHWFGGDVFGVDGFVFRLQNFFWVFVSSVLMIGSLRRLRVPARVAAGMGAIWVLLPIHSELLMWPSARKDCLAIAFGLAALYAFLRHLQAREGWRWGLAAVAFYVLSLLSKASLSLIPLAIPLVSILGRSGFAWRKRVVAVWLPALCLGIGSALLQAFLYSRVNDMRFLYTWDYRLKAVFAAFGRYWLGLADPALFGVDVENWGNWVELNSAFVFPGMIALSCLGGLSLWAWFRGRAGLLLVLCVFWLTYLPVSGLGFPHRNFYSVRYFEIPLLALMMGAAVWMSGLSRRHSGRLAIAALGLILVLGAAELSEAKCWDDELGPFLKSLKVTPENPSLLWITHNVLENARRWKRLTPETARISEQVNADLQRICDIHPAAQDLLNSHLCLGLWIQESFVRKTLNLSPGTIDAAEKSLERVSPSSYIGFGLKRGLFAVESTNGFLSERQLHEFDQGFSYQTGPGARLTYWSAACLAHRTDAARKLYTGWSRQHLMDEFAFAEYLSDVERRFPELVQRLRRCKPQG